jgi:hypothetical protein
LHPHVLQTVAADATDVLDFAAGRSSYTCTQPLSYIFMPLRSYPHIEHAGSLNGAPHFGQRCFTGNSMTLSLINHSNW